jgi:hypothetical protein
MGHALDGHSLHPFGVRKMPECMARPRYRMLMPGYWLHRVAKLPPALAALTSKSRSFSGQA